MTIVNPSKALIALVAMICLTVLMAVSKIPTEAGVGLIGSIVGYSIGNGIQARTGKPVEPIIGPKSKTSGD